MADNKLQSLKCFPELTKVMDEQGILKHYVVYATLKKEHSSIHDVKSKKGVGKIASILGCSISSVKRNVQKLVNLGFAWYENTSKGTDLRFVSHYSLLQKYVLNKKAYGRNLPYIGGYTVYLLRAQVIEQNLKQQESAINNKVSEFGKILSKLRQNNHEDALKFMLSQERKGTGFNVNVETTVTRGKVAKISSKKSKTTGRAYLNKFAQLGLIKEDTHRITKLMNYTDKSYKQHYDNSVYQNQKGELWMQLPNKVKFNSVDSIWDLVKEINAQLTKKGLSFKCYYDASIFEVLSLNGAYMDNRTSLSKKLRNNGFNLSNTVKKGLEIVSNSDYTATTYLQKAQLNASNNLYN
jgi:nitrate/TMAO reductase-like tetraheme cytochrome c subunit